MGLGAEVVGRGGGGRGGGRAGVGVGAEVVGEGGAEVVRGQRWWEGRDGCGGRGCGQRW